MLSSKLKLDITARNPFSLFNYYCSSFCTRFIDQLDEKQSVNLSLHNIMMTNLNDYKIIKEGEAEILMYAKNEVFYNKAQVNNRDILISVLRTFISKRKEEHEAMLTKRMKGAHKVSENNSSESVMEEEVSQKIPPEDHKSNGECKVEEEISAEGEPCSTMEGSMKTTEDCNTTEEQMNPTEVKGKRELKPPRVLEALSASGLRALRYAREVDGIGQELIDYFEKEPMIQSNRMLLESLKRKEVHSSFYRKEHNKCKRQNDACCV